MCRTDVTFSSEMLCFSFTKLNTYLKASVNTLALRCPQREREKERLLSASRSFDADGTFLLVRLVNQTGDLQNLSKYQNEKSYLLSVKCEAERQLELSWIQSSYSEFLWSLRHHHYVEHVLSFKQPCY